MWRYASAFETLFTKLVVDGAFLFVAKDLEGFGDLETLSAPC